MGRSATDILAQHGIGLTEEELEHAGVKGMKWGRRKKKEAASVEKEKIKTMSDDELKAKINRLKLEKEYKTLTAPEISQGRKIVGEILKDVGKQHAKAYLNRELEKMLTPSGTKLATKLAVAAAPKPAKQVLQFSKRPGF